MLWGLYFVLWGLYFVLCLARVEVSDPALPDTEKRVSIHTLHQH